MRSSVFCANGRLSTATPASSACADVARHLDIGPLAHFGHGVANLVEGDRSHEDSGENEIAGGFRRGDRTFDGELQGRVVERLGPFLPG